MRSCQARASGSRARSRPSHGRASRVAVRRSRHLDHCYTVRRALVIVFIVILITDCPAPGDVAEGPVRSHSRRRGPARCAFRGTSTSAFRVRDAPLVVVLAQASGAQRLGVCRVRALQCADLHLALVWAEGPARRRESRAERPGRHLEAEVAPPHAHPAAGPRGLSGPVPGLAIIRRTRA